MPTARKIISTLHGVLEYSISQDWAAVNVASGIKGIGPRSEGSKKVVPPTKAEMRAILDAADDGLQFMILFAAATSVRAGEQWAVRWSDIDFDDDVLMGPRHVSDTSFPEDHFSDPEGGSALLGAHEASVAVGKRHDEEMGPMPHASDDRIRLAKVRLSMAWRMRQRHEHLPVATADNGLARV